MTKILIRKDYKRLAGTREAAQRTCADVGLSFVLRHGQKHEEEFDPAEIHNREIQSISSLFFFSFVMTS